ncbi:MAG: His/Gly/Thr/Pro-type tRNA ligase C-terminal domain-containing protein, partial [Christensenellales bacterium]
DRTDYDLRQHMQASGENFEYLDPVTGERYVPYCIEPSLGADRVALAFLCDSYDEEEIGADDTRIVLRLHPALAPYKAAVLPLQKKLSEPAMELYHSLASHHMVDYDETGSIGKRYRRQDEVGTPLCVTFDFDSLADQAVTIRDRDTMEQVRLPIDNVLAYIDEKVRF